MLSNSLNYSDPFYLGLRFKFFKVVEHAGWRVLKDFLPIEAVNRGRGRRGLKRTDLSSTAYSGGLAAARHGETFRPNTATGTRSIGGSGAGARPGSRRLYRLRWPRSWRTAATTASIVLQFAPMSRQRAEKGDSSTSSWPFAGRVHQ